ncbi:MAG: amylo-alpha-1,6-glucosidase [Polyangiales bacterium]
MPQITKRGDPLPESVIEAKQAAVEVLLHNASGPVDGLPRTAGWGYPEPYTRDLMLSAFGILVSGSEELVETLGRTLTVLAQNQTQHGHIPSMIHDPDNLGSSDSTSLFLIAVGLYRRMTGNDGFLDDAAQKALTWMQYQSPDDTVMVGQLPTSDWRDEHWVLGYGLYVNSLVHTHLRLHGRDEEAEKLRSLMNRLDVRRDVGNRHIHEGLIVPSKPYFAMYAYKIYNNERFDLLGNCLASLTGIASRSRCERIVRWVEAECAALREQGELAVDLPPCLLPYVRGDDPDWRPRYERFNQAGEYHNGGIWPFICGLYVATCVAAGRHDLARRKLLTLTDLVTLHRRESLTWGFNEWIKAQTGKPMGCDWQSWSAAMYLYAVACVERRSTPFFDQVRARTKT